MSLTPPMPQSVAAPTPTAAPKSGLVGFIDGRPEAAFAAFLALHLTAWTALPALLFPNLPLDLIEALVYGREWPLGSDKLPPLPWWLVEIVHRLFGTDAAYYALAQAVVLIAFALVFATARPLVGATGALVAVLIIDGMHYFQFTAVKFNHDVVQLPLWALAGYAFHAALKRGRLGDWLLLGFAFGGALWAKYFVVVLAVPYALFLLLDRDARRALRTPGPWLGIAVAVLVALPHLVWLVDNDFAPFAYADARATPIHSWFDHIRHPAAFVGGQFLFILPALLIAAALVWPRSTQPPPAAADDFDRRIATLLAFGPAAAITALIALSGRGAIMLWGYPLWLFLGLWIVLFAPNALDAERLRRVVSTWAAVFVALVVIFIVDCTVLPLINQRYRAEFFPGDRLATVLTLQFHAATGEPLRYVVGTTWIAGNVAHYSPDQPEVLIDGLPRRAPWIDLNDLRAKGALLVWDIDPEKLLSNFAPISTNVELGTPFILPMRYASGVEHIGFAILKPQAP